MYLVPRNNGTATLHQTQAALSALCPIPLPLSATAQLPPDLSPDSYYKLLADTKALRLQVRQQAVNDLYFAGNEFDVVMHFLFGTTIPN